MTEIPLWRCLLVRTWPENARGGARRCRLRAAVRRLIAAPALDERSVYFLARLSPRYPTVEVRVADVCLDAGTAVLAAGLTRALVATALAEARRGTPVANATPAALASLEACPGQNSAHGLHCAPWR